MTRRAVHDDPRAVHDHRRGVHDVSDDGCFDGQRSGHRTRAEAARRSRRFLGPEPSDTALPGFATPSSTPAIGATSCLRTQSGGPRGSPRVLRCFRRTGRADLTPSTWTCGSSAKTACGGRRVRRRDRLQRTPAKPHLQSPNWGKRPRYDVTRRLLVGWTEPRPADDYDLVAIGSSRSPSFTCFSREDLPESVLSRRIPSWCSRQIARVRSLRGSNAKLRLQLSGYRSNAVSYRVAFSTSANAKPDLVATIGKCVALL